MLLDPSFSHKLFYSTLNGHRATHMLVQAKKVIHEGTMKNFIILQASFYVLLFLIISNSLQTNAQTCRPSGHIRGRKPPPGQCMENNDSLCCVPHKLYSTYRCSPPVSANTSATLTINSFQKGGDGGAPSKCDNQYHSDDNPVVALSTGWYKNGERCRNFIRIHANDRSIKAMVVDECDSSVGCDKHHDYLPPCQNNLVVASKAVWEGLEIPRTSWGEMHITWTDA
ncbi:putative RlpA-like domain superfamily, kiwellin [Helianthus annuus]|nr:putative RlpA-like domain superfamily, kiwellin [Helianthus annuus]